MKPIKTSKHSRMETGRLTKIPWYRQRPGALQSERRFGQRGGLVGITLHPSAQAKFSLISPELARLAEEANNMAGVSTKLQDQYHNLKAAVLSREEKASAS